MCKLCDITFWTLEKYEKHQYYHRNERNTTFMCGRSNCSLMFNRYVSFRSHIIRNHKFENTVKISEKIFRCSLSNCLYGNAERKTLLFHVYNHIKNGSVVKCPLQAECNFIQCLKTIISDAEGQTYFKVFCLEMQEVFESNIFIDSFSVCFGLYFILNLMFP